MTAYLSQDKTSISPDTILAARFNNQISYDKQTDVSDIRGNSIFYLELLVADSGKTLTLKDGDGDTVFTVLASFQDSFSPIRLDKGFQITGDVAHLKGFWVHGVL